MYALFYVSEHCKLLPNAGSHFTYDLPRETRGSSLALYGIHFLLHKYTALYWSGV